MANMVQALATAGQLMSATCHGLWQLHPQPGRMCLCSRRGRERRSDASAFLTFLPEPSQIRLKIAPDRPQRPLGAHLGQCTRRYIRGFIAQALTVKDLLPRLPQDLLLRPVH